MHKAEPKPHLVEKRQRSDGSTPDQSTKQKKGKVYTQRCETYLTSNPNPSPIKGTFSQALSTICIPVLDINFPEVVLPNLLLDSSRWLPIRSTFPLFLLLH